MDFPSVTIDIGGHELTVWEPFSGRNGNGARRYVYRSPCSDAMSANTYTTQGRSPNKASSAFQMVMLQVEFGRVLESDSRNGWDRDDYVFVQKLPFRQVGEPLLVSRGTQSANPAFRSARRNFGSLDDNRCVQIASATRVNEVQDQNCCREI